MNPLRMLLQPNHRVAEFGAFQRLLQEVRASQAHGAQQQFLARLKTRKNHVESRDRQLHLLQRAQALLRIGRDVQQNRRLRVEVQIVQDARREIGTQVFVFPGDLRVRGARQLLAHEIMKAGFGARYDQLNRHKTSSPFSAAVRTERTSNMKSPSSGSLLSRRRNSRLRVASGALDLDSCGERRDLEWLQAEQRQKVVKLISNDADRHRIGHALAAAAAIA